MEARAIEVSNKCPIVPVLLASSRASDPPSPGCRSKRLDRANSGAIVKKIGKINGKRFRFRERASSRATTRTANEALSFIQTLEAFA